MNKTWNNIMLLVSQSDMLTTSLK